MIKYLYGIKKAFIYGAERGYLMNGFDGNNNPYNIFDKRGRRKNRGWSMASVACSLLSFFMCIFGWAGLVLGIVGIILAGISRAKLGYFNTWTIAGILIGIFGIVFSTSIIFISYTSPELLKEIFSFSTVPETGVPTNPNTTNKI